MTPSNICWDLVTKNSTKQLNVLINHKKKVDPDVTKIYITLIVITWEEGFKNSTALLEYVPY